MLRLEMYLYAWLTLSNARRGRKPALHLILERDDAENWVWFSQDSVE